MKTAILPAIALLALVGCTDNNVDERAVNEPSVAEPAPAGQAMNTEEEIPAPADQAMSSEDQQLAQKVEQVLKEDLSTSDVAKNIEISARNGEVILEGSVETEQQKASIEKKVQQIVGVTKVNNQLAVG